MKYLVLNKCTEMCSPNRTQLKSRKRQQTKTGRGGTCPKRRRIIRDRLKVSKTTKDGKQGRKRKIKANNQGQSYKLKKGNDKTKRLNREKKCFISTAKMITEEGFWPQTK